MSGSKGGNPEEGEGGGSEERKQPPSDVIPTKREEL